MKHAVIIVMISALVSISRTAEAAEGDFCPALPPPSGSVIDVGPDQVNELPAIVASAATGDTIRLADGYYGLNGSLLLFATPGVTLRSLSGNREAVVLDGSYQGGNIISITASDVTVADLAVQRAYWHPIHVYPSSGHVTNTLIHNLRVIDPGEQAIKINPNAGYFADNGVIRCSHLELTDEGRPFIRNNCYTGGVDAHQAWGWQVRDNSIAGFWCRDGLSEHGIHFWTGSRDTLVERNLISNSARGVGLGLGEGTPGRTYEDDPCPGVPNVGHYGGIVRNNFVLVNDDRLFDEGYGGFDLGVGLEQACGAQVLHNTVFSTRAPFSSIEWRFPSTAAAITNNLVSHNLRPRDGATATVEGNLEDAPASFFVDPVSGGDLHLTAAAGAAIDQGVPIGGGLADEDIDGDLRDASPDIGADEYGAQGATILGRKIKP